MTISNISYFLNISIKQGSAALPLMCPRGGNYYLTGISVFGSGRNCDASQPYVATRIPAFIQWISSKISKN